MAKVYLDACFICGTNTGVKFHSSRLQGHGECTFSNARMVCDTCGMGSQSQSDWGNVTDSTKLLAAEDWNALTTKLWLKNQENLDKK